MPFPLSSTELHLIAVATMAVVLAIVVLFVERDAAGRASCSLVVCLGIGMGIGVMLASGHFPGMTGPRVLAWAYGWYALAAATWLALEPARLTGTEGNRGAKS